MGRGVRLSTEADRQAFWAPPKTDADAAGTPALVEVLLLHRSMTHEEVVAGLGAALQVGAVTADMVAVETRRAANTDQVAAGPGSPSLVECAGVSLTQRRLADPGAVTAGSPTKHLSRTVGGPLRRPDRPCPASTARPRPRPRLEQVVLRLD